MEQNSEKKTPAGMRYGESAFDIGYLLFDLIAGIIFLQNGRENEISYLFALLAFVLGGGDAFHLIPRVIMHLKGKSEKIDKWLGIGMAVTSVTMTIFYLILYTIWKKLFPQIEIPDIIPVLLYSFAIIRIIICLMPQNKWTKGGDYKWGIYRNVPFIVVGVIMIGLFILSGNLNGLRMWRMAIAITLSFGFYLPVTFGAKKNPMLGALMLPKTLMYIWMLVMGLQFI